MKYLKKISKILLILLILVFSALIFSKLTAKADSLIGFNEGQGPIVHDTSGSASGTITNALWKPAEECLSGPCLYFDGTGDFVSFGNESTYNFAAATNWTIEFWFKTGPISARSRVLIAKYSTAGYKIYMSSDGKLNFGVDDDASWEPDDIVTSVSRYDDNKWHHLVAAKTGTANLTLYADAIRVGQKNTLNTADTLSNSGNFYLGIDSDGSSNGFSGYIDELKIVVASARTADQIKTDYLGATSSRGTNVALSGVEGSNLTSGLIGYWKMDEATWATNCSTASAIDSSGNSNNGKPCPNASAPTLAAGKYGNAGSFSTSNDYLDAGNQTSLSISSEITISAWVRVTSYGGWYDHWIVNKGDGTYLNYWMNVREQSGYFPEFSFSTAGGADNNWRATTSISADTWTYLSISYKYGVGSSIRYYANGILLPGSWTSGNGNVSPYTGSDILTIGGHYVDGYAFLGSIDELRVYNRTLSPSEVSQLYTWAPGPIGWWKLDEGSGTSANDSSGNNFIGTWSGTGTPRWISGKYGTAANFNGTDDVVTVGDISSKLNLISATPPSFTISGWFNSGSGNATTTGIQLVTSQARLYYHSSQRFGFQLVSSSTQAFTPVITANTWYHVEGVYDKEANLIKIYLNGVLSDSQTPATTDLSGGATNMKIGNAQNYLKGALDDIRVYNYARTQKQIVEDMQNDPPNGASPLLYYDFDEGTGSTTHNLGFGGTTLNGTITSGTWTTSGKKDSALTFAASTSVTTTIVDPGYTNSISMWLYPSAIIGKTILATNKLVADGSSKPVYGGCIGNSIPLNTWTHLVVVSDSSASCRMYQNGILTATGTSGVTFGTTLNLGASSYVGLIDEFKFYNFALTPAEVALDFNAGAAQMGAVSTASNGTTPDNSASREFCVPGDTSTCNPPVGWWKMDEGMNDTLYDSSGNGNNLTPNNTSGHQNYPGIHVPGKYGNAISLDWSKYLTASQAYDIADNATLSMNNTSFTITGWVKLNPSVLTNGENQYAIVGKNYYDINQSEYAINFYNPGVMSAGNFNFNVSSNGTNSTQTEVTYDDLGGINTNQWYFVAAWYDSVNHKIYLQVNNVVKSADFTGPVYDGTSAFSIGKFEYDTYWDGAIDDVKVYKYVRTPAQIAWDYNRGAPVAQYDFDECTGTVLHDTAPKADRSITPLNGTILPQSSGQTTVGDCTTNADTMWYNGRTGKYSSSLNFDGVDDYVDLGTIAPINSGAQLSVSYWVKPNADVTQAGHVFKWNHDGATALNAWAIRTQNPATDEIYVFIAGAADAGTRYFATSNLDLPNNTWSQISFVYYGAGVTNADRLKVYKNGVQINGTFPESDIPTSLNTSTNYTYIGNDLNTTAGQNNFSGQIDDVRIYNYALTPAQVKSLYNNSSAVSF